MRARDLELRKAEGLVGEAVAGLPLSPFHLSVWLAVATVFAACGSSNIIVPWLVQSMRRVLHLDPIEEGVLSGCVYSGMAVGAVLMGPVADHFGRRPVVLASMAAVLSLQVSISQLSHTVYIAPVLFVRGIALIWAEFVSKLVLTEIAPQRLRGLQLSSVHAMFQLGGVLATLYTFIYVFYRRLAAISALSPFVALACVAAGLPESPMWLLQARGVRAARDAVLEIARRAHADSPAQMDAAPMLSSDLQIEDGDGSSSSGADTETILSDDVPRSDEMPQSKPSSSSTLSSDGEPAAAAAGGASKSKLLSLQRQVSRASSQVQLMPQATWHVAKSISSRSLDMVTRLREADARAKLLRVAPPLWMIAAWATQSSDFLLLRFLRMSGYAHLERDLCFAAFGAKLCGGLLAGAIVDRIGRTRLLFPTLVLSAAGSALVAIARGDAALSASVLLLYLASEAMQATASTYTYEVFSTETRACAVSACVAISRLSATIAVGLGPALMEAISPAAPIMLNAGLFLIAAVWTVFSLPADTTSMPLS